MNKTFLVSDTHFGHKGVCHFLDCAGEKIRPWTCPVEMTRDMIARWNAKVGSFDKVYHLGDVVINRSALQVLHQLNGNKVLIKGNHDNFKLHEYTDFFLDVRGSHVLNGFILTHIPVHETQFGRWKGNIHGHLHSNELPDPRYMNVCVEKTDFAPIDLNEVFARYKSRGIE